LKNTASGSGNIQKASGNTAGYDIQAKEIVFVHRNDGKLYADVTLLDI
jgi:hypothetical protein